MTPEQAEAVRVERQALTELMQAKLLRAAYSERQLEEVMVDFWFNHFNVFSGKGQVRVYLNEYERDAIRPHVFGTFRALLQATAESPAMLFYLDNWQSSAPEGARNGGATARERPDEPAQPESDAGRVREPDSPGSAESPAHAGRPAARAAEPPRRPQRKLRPRADGAAHARRRRRLHAEGRAGSRARVHRLDDRQSATGWRLPLRAADARRWREGRARQDDQGGRRQEGRREGARPPGEPPVDGDSSSRPSSRVASSPTSRRRRSSSARRAASARPTATSAKSCEPSSPRPSSSLPRRTAPRSRRRSSSSSAPCARRAST